MLYVAAGSLYYMRIIWLINGLCIQQSCTPPIPQPEVTKHHEQTDVVQLKYKIVSCIPDSQTSSGNRKVVAIAGHVRQEIEGDPILCTMQTIHLRSQIISHYGIIWQNIIYNIGRVIIVLPVYGDNLCCSSYD